MTTMSDKGTRTSSELKEIKINILKKLNTYRNKDKIIEDIDISNHPGIVFLNDSELFSAGNVVLRDAQFSAVLAELINAFDVKQMVELTLVDTIGFNYSTKGLIKFLIDKYITDTFVSYMYDIYRNMITWFVAVGCVPYKYIRISNIEGKYSGSGKRTDFTDKMVSPGTVHSFSKSNTILKDTVITELMSTDKKLLPVVIETLMLKHFDQAIVKIVKSYIETWVTESIEDAEVNRDPDWENTRPPQDPTELKLGIINIWEFLKTVTYGFLPYVPICDLTDYICAFDTISDTVVISNNKNNMFDVLVWKSLPEEETLYSYAVESKYIVTQWSNIVTSYMKACSSNAGRKFFTTRNTHGGSKHKPNGSDIFGLSSGQPTQDQTRKQLSRVIASEYQTILNTVTATAGLDMVTKNKLDSISSELSDELSALIRNSSENIAIKEFVSVVLKNPQAALNRLISSNKASYEFLTAANKIVAMIGQLKIGPNEDVSEMIGDDIDLVCQYNSTTSISDVEEALAAWLTYWRAKLTGGQNGYSQRKNVIQYNGNETKSTRGPSTVLESLFLNIINKSGIIFKTIHKPPNRGLTITDILMLNHTVAPAAMSVILSAQLGIRPADVLVQKLHQPTQYNKLDKRFSSDSKPDKRHHDGQRSVGVVKQAVYDSEDDGYEHRRRRSRDRWAVEDRRRRPRSVDKKRRRSESEEAPKKMKRRRRHGRSPQGPHRR